MIDADGNTLIDFQNNYTALVHGHANPEIVAALRGQLEIGTCFGLPTRSEVLLAEMLVDRMPSLERVRFANSGTEAMMMAIRAARAFTGRREVLYFANCYHGSYDATLPGEAPGVVQSGVVVPFNDAERVRAAIQAWEEELACIVLDLMPNRAGLHPAEKRFVEVVREGTRRHGIVLILDEVITSRLRPGGLQAEYGLDPDLVTLGKWIGGGLPIGAFGGQAQIMDLFDPRRADRVDHGGTFSANPLSMVAGATAVRLLSPSVIARMNSLGDRLRQALGRIGYLVAGSGSLIKVRHPLADPTALWWSLYSRGVLIAANGLMCTSSPMNDDVVDETTARFEEVWTDLEGATRCDP